MNIAVNDMPTSQKNQLGFLLRDIAKSKIKNDLTEKIASHVTKENNYSRSIDPKMLKDVIDNLADRTTEKTYDLKLVDNLYKKSFASQDGENPEHTRLLREAAKDIIDAQEARFLKEGKAAPELFEELRKQAENYTINSTVSKSAYETKLG